MSSLYYLGLCFCRSIINLRQLCSSTIYMVVHKLLNLQQQTTFKRCIAKISSFTHTLNMQHRLGFEETAVSNQITAASRQLHAHEENSLHAVAPIHNFPQCISIPAATPCTGIRSKNQGLCVYLHAQLEEPTLCKQSPRSQQFDGTPCSIKKVFSHSFKNKRRQIQQLQAQLIYGGGSSQNKLLLRLQISYSDSCITRVQNISVL